MTGYKQTTEVAQLRSQALSFAHFQLYCDTDGEIWYADGQNGWRLCLRIGHNSIDFFAFERNNDYYHGVSKDRCLGYDGSEEKRNDVIRLKKLTGVP